MMFSADSSASVHRFFLLEVFEKCTWNTNNEIVPVNLNELFTICTVCLHFVSACMFYACICGLLN